MKAQASLEYIIIIGVIIIGVIPLFYYGLTKTRENVRIEQVSDTVNSLAKTADEVYSLGLGSRDFIWVNTPTGINSVSINGKTITLTISIFGSTSDIIGISKANLTSSQDFLNKIVLPGRYKVSVETFRNTTNNQIMVLLGGYCGDNLCSSIENPTTCSSDCLNVCGDGVCIYPGNSSYSEGCLTIFCTDCIGSQANCDVGEICTSSGTCIQAAGTCGDNICYLTPYVENCRNCAQDCLESSTEKCCDDPILGISYTIPISDNCGIPPSVTDCGDYCVWLSSQGFDYENGVCRQSVAQCTTHGEVYESGGDPYCTGDPVIDTCCCVPD